VDHFWHIISVYVVGFGTKWELGAIQLIKAGQPFWTVFWKSLIPTTLPILLVFGTLDFVVIFIKFIIKQAKRINFVRRIFAKRKKTENEFMEAVAEQQKRIKRRIWEKTKELIQKNGYKAFFFLSVIPFVPYVPEIAAAACVSLKMQKKGFWLILAGNTIKIFGELVFMYGAVYVYRHYFL
jgi:hypothetical protein